MPAPPWKRLTGDFYNDSGRLSRSRRNDQLTLRLRDSRSLMSCGRRRRRPTTDDRRPTLLPANWGVVSVGASRHSFGRRTSVVERPSRPQLVHHPRERYHLANVGCPADPSHGTLQPEPESRVHEGAVLAKIEVPPVR